MIFSERISINKTPQYGSKIAEKKFVIIKDQLTDQLLLRIHVHPCMSISTLKQKLQVKIGGSGGIGQIRLRYKQQILLNNNASIADLNIKNESIIYYASHAAFDNYGMIHAYDFGARSSKQMSSVLGEIRKAFQHKITPKLTEDGTSGSYFLENIDRNNVAIFKPLDEEPYTPNNPKGYIGKMGQTGIRNGIRSGEQGYREVVAYLLDPEGFHDVPPTTFVELYHPAFNIDPKIPTVSDNGQIQRQQSFIQGQPSEIMEMLSKDKRNSDLIKCGSLQAFVKNTDECGNYGSSIFSIDEVHKIAILDIRILNCDRNDQNILVKKKKKKINVTPQELQRLPKYKAQMLEYDFQLIPIDHGLSLPDCFQVCQEDLNWMWWEQSEQNFSAKSLEYIKKINIKQDMQLLTSKLNLRSECLVNFRLASIVLQKGAQAGLTPKEIGGIIYRPDTDIESIVEKLISDARSYTHVQLKSGNSEIIQNQLIKEKAKNDRKKEREMPIIIENISLEEGQSSSKILDQNIDEGEESKDSNNNKINFIISKPHQNGGLKGINSNNYHYGEEYAHSDDELDAEDHSELKALYLQKFSDSSLFSLMPVLSLNSQISASSQGSNGVGRLKIKRSFSLPDLQHIHNKTSSISNEESPKNGNDENKAPTHSSEKKTVKFDTNDTSKNGGSYGVCPGKGIKIQMVSKMKSENSSSSNKSKKIEEEFFFLNFEKMLDTHIQKIILEKNAPTKGGRRGRYNSEELSVSELRKN